MVMGVTAMLGGLKTLVGFLVRGAPGRVRAGLLAAGAVTALTLGSLLLMLFWSAPSANAIVCGSMMNVGSTADLNDAIGCYNAASPGSGPYTINVTVDISYTAGNVVTEINQADAATVLTIDGAGRAVSGPGGAVLDEDLFSVAGAGEVIFDDIVISDAAGDGIDVGPAAGVVEIVDSTVSRAGSRGIFVFGGSVTVSNSTITDSNAAGVFGNGGSVLVSNSTISDSGADGVRVLAGSVSVSNSTVSGSTFGGFSVGAGSVAVSNSTISGSSGHGIVVSGGSVSVSNSTVANSGTAGTGGIGVFGSAGSASVVSSVVTEGCSVSVTGSDNFTTTGGACGAGSAVMTGTLGPLFDNGCAVATPSGCVATQALGAGSNAIDAGTCMGVVLSVDSAGQPVIGSLSTDERGAGFVRTIGVECDAGAFEAESCSAMTVSSAVTSSAELNLAIGCFNAQTPPGSYIITMANDLSYGSGNVVTPITQNDPAISLTIDGSGFIVSDPGGAPGQGLFSVSGSGEVTFDDIVIHQSAGHGIEIAAATVNIVDSTISGSGLGGVQALLGASVSVSGSTISNSNFSGVVLGGGSVSLSNSTISGSGSDGLRMFGASSVSVSGSTVSGSGDDGIHAQGGSLSISNSTVSFSGAHGLNAFSLASVLVADSTVSFSFGNNLNLLGTTASVTNSTLSTSGSGGVYVDGGSVSVSGSTIFDGFNGIVAEGGTVAVSNSTISESVLEGVLVNGGSVSVSNSTIAESGSDGVELFSGSVSVVSSVVTEGCVGATGSNNFTATGGACGAGSSVLTGTLGALADNGCAVPTASGCVQTHALPAGSNALDAGDCTDVTVRVGVTADLIVDQRDEPRTPALCDAGAFERPPDPVCDGKPVTIDMNLNGGIGTGTAADDVILGTPLADSISGSGGDDTICAGEGDDTIRGGSGADTIFGEGGLDVIRGGGGADLIDGGPGRDEILGQGGTDTLDGGLGDDVLDGQGAADTIVGGGGADTINGQNGADDMSGGNGQDTIRGQTGPDTFRGEADDDELFGGNGNDTFFGGSGVDKCAGNLGPNDQAEAATCEQTPGVETLF